MHVLNTYKVTNTVPSLPLWFLWLVTVECAPPPFPCSGPQASPSSIRCSIHSLTQKHFLVTSCPEPLCHALGQWWSGNTSLGRSWGSEGGLDSELVVRARQLWGEGQLPWAHLASRHLLPKHSHPALCFFFSTVLWGFTFCCGQALFVPISSSKKPKTSLLLK